MNHEDDADNLAAFAPTQPGFPPQHLSEPTSMETEIPSTLSVPSSPGLSLGPVDGMSLIDEIGRGGMGVVLRMHDPALKREVAMKVLTEAAGKRPGMARRFEEEAQIGGQLQHPGVVPVYALGKLEDGKPYFTMKLIKGQTLSKHLKARADASADRPRFLKIFEQLCQTIAYAHSKRVIHRDLKPANVMIGNFGEVQVMDWGLAKVLDSPENIQLQRETESHATVIRTVRTSPTGTVEIEGTDTQAGSVLGTPAYMPPEQAVGAVEFLDERSDVFGLGAILCEILTGNPPYVADHPSTIFHMALAADLGDALKRLDAVNVDRELVELAKKCLAPKPQDRLPNAGALAEELTHYLNSVDSRLQVEQLGRIEAQAKAIEEQKRRRLQFKYSAVTCAILLGGIVGTSIGFVKADTARRLAEIAQANERTQREAAEKSRQEAAADRDRALAAEKNERQQRKLADQLRLEAVESKNDTEAFSKFLVDHVLASARPKGADAGLGVNITMAAAMAEAEKNIAAVFDGQPRAEATARDALGVTWREYGKYPEAERQLRLAAEIRSKMLGESDDLTLQTYNSLGVALLRAGKGPEAIAIFEKIRDAYARKYPPQHPEYVKVLNNLAVAYKNAGKVKDAIRIYEKIREIQTRFPPASEGDVFKTLQNLAQAYAADQRLEEALGLLVQVRNASATKLGLDDPMTLTVSNNLALMYFAGGNRKKAIELFEQVRAGRIKVLNADHPLTLTTMHNLGTVYYADGRKADAFKLFEEVCKGRVQRFGVTNALTQATLRDLATKYRESGNFNEAKVIEKQIVASPSDKK